MTSKDLLALMECKRKYMLRRLSLKGQNERGICFNEALRICAKGIAQGKDLRRLPEEIRSYLESAYQEEWFLPGWQKERTIHKEAGFFWRFLDSPFLREIVGNRQNEIIADYPVEVQASMRCNEVDVTRISGRADLLVKNENDGITGIILCRKFMRPYSYRARKEENKVMGSVELLTLLGSLRTAFPDCAVSVAMVRLVSPADKNQCMAEFDKKKGDNIIRFTEEEFLATHPEGVEAYIRHLVENAELGKCADCSFEEMCRSTNKVYVGRQEERPALKKEFHFSPLQMAVIVHERGPIRLCAGPGSGKTAVLVARVKQLIESGVPPKRILAITFTKKAAQEMAERIGMSDGPVVSTLHAQAFGILTEHEGLIGTVRLAGKVDCKNLLMRILEHAPIISGVSYDGITMRYGLITMLFKDFDFIQRNGEETYRKANPKKDVDGILRVKQMYDEAFRERGFITYDDQITLAVDLLKEYEGVLDTVRDAFDYVMVDEVQDLDGAQAEFVQLLVKAPENNIMVCGDADQSIYAFRGGSNQFMLDFPTVYPGAEDWRMEENYRSSKEIVELADCLISRNTKRVPMNFKAMFETGFKAIHIPFFKESHITDLIMEILQKGYAYQDIAVIARTNKELLRLCECADRAALEGGTAVPMERPKFYLREDFVFCCVLDLLELSLKGMGRDKPLFRLLSGLGCEVSKENRNLSLYEDHLAQGLIYGFDGEEASLYFLTGDNPGQDTLRDAYGKIYRALQKLNLPIKQALAELEAEFFPERICTAEVFEKIQDIVYEKKIRSKRQLYEAMEAMMVFEDDTRVYYASGDKNQVHMLTAHDAKGKEFPVVIIYGIDEFDGEDVEEDRRLLYVALTRAKRVLFLLESYPGKSRFLQEIEPYVAVNRRERYEK